MSMIALIAIAVVALIVLLFIGVRAEPEEGGEEMIKNVYVYLVLFATLMMTIGGSVAVFMAAADIVSPVTYHQTFEDYKQLRDAGKIPVETADGKVLSEEEMRINYDEMVAAEKERQVDRAKNSLIKALGWIVIPLPVFIYFQRRRTVA